jgi:hypothetical protein
VEAHLASSYAPLTTSKVAGRLFCTCTELIEPVLAERPAENVAEA